MLCPVPRQSPLSKRIKLWYVSRKWASLLPKLGDSLKGPNQTYLKFPGLVILNPVLMKIRIVSGSHQIGPIGEMLNPGSEA